MSRTTIQVAALTVVLSAGIAQPATAQGVGSSYQGGYYARPNVNAYRAGAVNQTRLPDARSQYPRRYVASQHPHAYAAQTQAAKSYLQRGPSYRPTARPSYTRLYRNPQGGTKQIHYTVPDRNPAARTQYAAHQQSGQTMTIQGQRPGTRQSVTPAYPYLNAPLYTAPRQDIPYQVGGTFYTNQAFSPHEMLHEHEYKALYPPYYYKVGGRWVVMPCGVWSSEHWDLQGTEVEIEYKNKKPLFSLFANPF